MRIRSDLTAGITVALLALPQAMAYALVAQLPLSAGLLSAVFGAILSAALGSSRHLVVGPTNAIAILIQSATADILYTHFRGVTGLEREIVAMQILAQLTLGIGILQFLAGLLRLGRLIQFVSRSVVVGYVNGAALAIIMSQLFVALGLPKDSSVYTVWGHLMVWLGELSTLHAPTLGVTLISLLVLVGIQRFFPRGAPSVIMLLVVSVLCSNFPEWHVHRVGNVGDISQVLPTWVWPTFDVRLLDMLLPKAFAIALLGILESTSAAKAVGARSGIGFKVNQEIRSLGIVNFFSAFLGAMPSSGSASRSFLNYETGGGSRWAAIISGVSVGLIWLLFSRLVEFIPLASLSAILFVTAFRMFDWRQIRLCVRATGSDALVVILTTLTALWSSLDVAFYVGVALSLTLYLKNVSQPHYQSYGFEDLAQQFPHLSGIALPHVRVVEVQGQLFFGSADLFQSAMQALSKDPETEVLVLRFNEVRSLDASTCMAIQQIHESLAKQGKQLLICEVHPKAWAVLNDSGVAQKLGKERITQSSLHSALVSVQ